MTDLTNIEFVFLDRDGVLNEKPSPGEYITSCEELIVLPGVPEAVAALNRSGRKVIVVTNQRGVARGLYTLHDLTQIHEKLTKILAEHGARLDAIYFCPHEEGQCACRKPGTGMFEQAFRDFPGAKPERSIMVGDSLRDIEAGLAARMRTAFVTNVRLLTDDDVRAGSLATVTIHSLCEFVDRYLAACRE